jgi:hypothetical protein
MSRRASASIRTTIRGGPHRVARHAGRRRRLIPAPPPPYYVFPLLPGQKLPGQAVANTPQDIREALNFRDRTCSGKCKLQNITITHGTGRDVSSLAFAGTSHLPGQEREEYGMVGTETRDYDEHPGETCRTEEVRRCAAGWLNQGTPFQRHGALVNRNSNRSRREQAKRRRNRRLCPVMRRTDIRSPIRAASHSSI